MNSSELISEIRELVNKARIDKALEKMLPWLEQERTAISSWTDTVRGLFSRYKKLQSDQQRNIISSEKADLTRSQITNSLLDILTAIEKGDGRELGGNTSTTKTSRIPWMPIGIVAVLILATVLFFMFRNGNSPTIPSVDSDSIDSIDARNCPKFDKESIFNIMILPYQPLDGKQKNIDRGLRIRLSEMMEEFHINGSVKGKKIDVNSPDYPLTANEVIPIAKPCKTQLVIWGFTEEIGEKTTTITKFRFLNKEHFALTGLDLNQVDTISSISSIATSQELTENIEKSISLIFGLVALETEHYAASTELLEETVNDRGGASEVPGWGLMLAESKIKSGDHDAAMVIYNEILEKNADNTEALTRKGILEFNLGDYEMAAVSFSPILKKNPDNTEIRVARATAYVRNNDLYQANTDLEMIEGRESNNVTISKNVRQEYIVRHRQETAKKSAAEETLKANPSDTSALRIQAQTSRNLGQFEVANIAATKLLASDPKNMAALTTLMQIKPMVRDTAKLQMIIQRAQQQFSPIQMQMIKPRIFQGGGN